MAVVAKKQIGTIGVDVLAARFQDVLAARFHDEGAKLFRDDVTILML
jgi:hypothetical protein